MSLVEYLNQLEEAQQIDSSCVKAIDYWEGSLYVKLTGGYIYRYDYVKESLYYDFINARSKGKFYLKNVRGQYRSTKIN